MWYGYVRCMILWVPSYQQFNRTTQFVNSFDIFRREKM